MPTFSDVILGTSIVVSIRLLLTVYQLQKVLKYSSLIGLRNVAALISCYLVLGIATVSMPFFQDIIIATYPYVLGSTSVIAWGVTLLLLNSLFTSYIKKIEAIYSRPV